ncbi:sigma factor-like helix-turn-helix DNA-binding protein [Lentzea sp. NPDC005914]|uniref:RNA polymerase sigma factor n=1 Tax=Lentzea sp. NPDC005914 TaxID=3154572 RepID=UPI0033CEC9FE
MSEDEPPDREADFRRFHRQEYPLIIAFLCHLGFSHHIADEAASEALEELYWSWFDVCTSRRMWVRTTAKRVAVRKAKAERGGPLNRLLDKGFRPQLEHDDSGLGEVVERHGGLVRAINSLPTSQREAFALHVDGFTAKEIAAALAIAERTVHHRIQRARTTLRALVASGEEK